MRISHIWFSNNLVDLAIDRDRLFRNYRMGGGKNKEIYKKAANKRRESNKLVKTAKDDFLRSSWS